MNNLYVRNDNRSKAPDKKPPVQKPPDNNPPRIIEEIIAKYAVDANLFRLGSTNPKKNPASVFFLGFYTGGLFSGGFCPGGFWPEAFDLDSFNRMLECFFNIF